MSQLPPIPFGRILRLGSRGNDVHAVKRALARAGYGGLGALDRLMGPRAVQNLKRFQRAEALDPDGVYGPVTHGRLRKHFDAWCYQLYTGHAPPSTETVQLPFPFKPTHDTGGLPGYPAIDVFAAPGTRVLAPRAGVLQRTHMIAWNVNKRVGGMTTYLDTSEGTFFLTHFDEVLPSGTGVRRGQDIGSVAAVPENAWPPHIHMGFQESV